MGEERTRSSKEGGFANLSLKCVNDELRGRLLPAMTC